MRTEARFSSTHSLGNRTMSEHNTFPGGDTASIWYGTFEAPTFPALSRDAAADVCVVGAGIAGLSTAYLLTKPGNR
jgi:NADPH-dependent 2,4-dienoyl-CoA reductase/sulfur reductase-like enzyme